jgi:hypothetical protein
MSTVEPGSGVYSKFLRGLRKICGTKELLPSSHILSDRLKQNGDSPSAFGGSADVWEGTYGDQKVAIKSLRIKAKAGSSSLKKESSSSELDGF